jgi:two-component system, LuxR family, response regulator FixJ
VSDIRMPGIDGLELQQRLRELKNTMPVIFITGHGDIQMAVQAMRQGAIDFLEKPIDDTILISSVNRALSATTPVASVDSSDVRQRLEGLTPREREVLDCLVMGKANKITAHDLGMSIRTVETHRARIMQKMQAGSLSELIRFVLSVGAISPQK